MKAQSCPAAPGATLTSLQSSQGVQGLVEGGVVDEPVQSHWGLFPQTGSPEGLTQDLPLVLKLSADRLDI